MSDNYNRGWNGSSPDPYSSNSFKDGEWYRGHYDRIDHDAAMSATWNAPSSSATGGSAYSYSSPTSSSSAGGGNSEGAAAGAALVLLLIYGLGWLIYKAFQLYSRLSVEWQCVVGPICLVPWFYVAAQWVFPFLAESEFSTFACFCAMLWIWLGALIVYFPLSEMAPYTSGRFAVSCYSMFPLLLTAAIMRNFPEWVATLSTHDSALGMAVQILLWLALFALTGAAIVLAFGGIETKTSALGRETLPSAYSGEPRLDCGGT